MLIDYILIYAGLIVRDVGQLWRIEWVHEVGVAGRLSMETY